MVMGKVATTTKAEREKRLSQRGPLSKAKRRSLKVASQQRKKEEMPRRWTVERERGRKKKRDRTGRTARSRHFPGRIKEGRE